MKWFANFTDLPVELEIAIHTEIEGDGAYGVRLLQIIPLEAKRVVAAKGEKLDEIGNEIRCYRKSWHRTEAKK